MERVILEISFFSPEWSLVIWCNKLWVSFAKETYKRDLYSAKRHEWSLVIWCVRFSMEWLRLVGSLKLQVSFTKEPYKRVISCHLVYQIQDGVATINRLLKIIGLFCKRALQKRPIFCKETYNCKEPTSRTHPTASWLLKIWFFSQSELSRVSLPQKSRLVSFFIKFKFLKSQFLSHGVHQRCTSWLKKVASWL